MALQVETARIDPDIEVVRVSGKLVFDGADALLSSIRVVLDQSTTKKLILDLTGVDEIDSVGGSCLISCFFLAREAEARLCVAGASISVMRLFKTTQKDTLIPFFPTVAAACDYLSNTPGAGAETA
jgi:anti-anti-sigma factor